MATKKQKREAALAKRAEFLEEEKSIGLRAQSLDRDSQARMNELMKAEADRINAMYRAVLQEEYGH